MCKAAKLSEAIPSRLFVWDCVENQATKETVRETKREDASEASAEGQKSAQVLGAEGERESKVLRAKGEAESRVIDANAQAEARMTVSEAEAKSLAMIQSVLTKADASSYLIAREYVKAFSQMTEGKNNKLVVVPYEASSLVSSLGMIKELFDKTEKQIE
jgi:regulator of protease activity HflC (stomatin/prohibitin superfamily)